MTFGSVHHAAYYTGGSWTSHLTSQSPSIFNSNLEITPTTWVVVGT